MRDVNQMEVELVPGFEDHGVRQYLYRLTASGAPTLELWVSSPGEIFDFIWCSPRG